MHPAMRRATTGLAAACAAGMITLLAATGAAADTGGQVAVQRTASGELVVSGSTSQVGDSVVVPTALVRSAVSTALADARSHSLLTATAATLNRTVDGTSKLVGTATNDLGLTEVPTATPADDPTRLSTEQCGAIEQRFSNTGPVNLATPLTKTGSHIPKTTVAQAVTGRVHDIVAHDYPTLDPSLAKDIDQQVNTDTSRIGDISETVAPPPPPPPPSTPTGGASTTSSVPSGSPSESAVAPGTSVPAETAAVVVNAPTASGIGRVPSGARFDTSPNLVPNLVPNLSKLDKLPANQRPTVDMRDAGKAKPIAAAPAKSERQMVPIVIAILVLALVAGALVRTWVARRSH